jgi:hypothetical protein
MLFPARTVRQKRRSIQLDSPHLDSRARQGFLDSTNDWEEPVLLQRLAPTERDASVLGAIIGEWRDPGLARVYDPAVPRSVASPERIFQPGP